METKTRIMEDVMKKLLVLAASLYQVDTILTAKRLGYCVVTTDNVPENPGHRLADISYSVDTTDKDAVLEIARKEGIHGIISPATDAAVPTLAYVGERLGLPVPSLASVEILCDKIEFRKLQWTHGFPAPRAEIVERVEDVRPEGFGLGPRVLKPDRSSGSKGTFIVRDVQDVQHRLPETLSFSRKHRAVLETFLCGEQGTVEGIVKDGKTILSFFLDRTTADPPHVTTLGHSIPARLSERSKRSLIDQLDAMWQILDSPPGPFDCDFVASEDETFILEIAPRIGGNSIARLLRLACGFDIIEYGVRRACGDPVDEPSSVSAHPTAIVLLGAQQEGPLQYDFSAADALRQEPWVKSLLFDVEAGTWVRPFINGRHRVGEAMVCAENRDDLDSFVATLRKRLAILP